MSILYFVFPNLCIIVFSRILFNYTHYQEVLNGKNRKHFLASKDQYGKKILKFLRILFRDTYRTGITEIVAFSKVPNIARSKQFIEELSIYTHYNEFHSGHYKNVAKETLEKDILQDLENFLSQKNYEEIKKIVGFSILVVD